MIPHIMLNNSVQTIPRLDRFLDKIWSYSIQTEVIKYDLNWMDSINFYPSLLLHIKENT